MASLRLLTVSVLLCAIFHLHSVQSAPLGGDYTDSTADFLSRFMSNLSQYVQRLINTSGQTAAAFIDPGTRLGTKTVSATVDVDNSPSRVDTRVFSVVSKKGLVRDDDNNLEVLT